MLAAAGAVTQVLRPKEVAGARGPDTATVLLAGSTAAGYVQRYLTLQPGVEAAQGVKLGPDTKPQSVLAWPVTVVPSEGGVYDVTVLVRFANGNTQEWAVPVSITDGNAVVRGYPRLLPPVKLQSVLGSGGSEAPPPMKAMLEGFFKTYLAASFPADIANFLSGVSAQPLGGALRFDSLEARVFTAQPPFDVLARVKAADPAVGAVYTLDYHLAVVSEGGRYLISSLH